MMFCAQRTHPTQTISSPLCTQLIINLKMVKSKRRTKKTKEQSIPSPTTWAKPHTSSLMNSARRSDPIRNSKSS